MESGSRIVSLGLATLITAILLAFLSLMKEATFSVLLVGGSICFATCFMLFFVVLEFLIFREVNRINEFFERFERGNFFVLPESRGNIFAPLQRTSRELQIFAASKQEEIGKLRKLELYRKEFIADISHELKTPLFAAQGFVHTLLDGAADDPQVRDKFLRKAAKSLDYLDELIQDLLTLSQLESGSIAMKSDIFNVFQLIEEIVEQFENKILKKNITIHLDQPQNRSPFVKADRFRISQVLANLIGNAIKYNNENGNVWIKIDSLGDHYKISVKDDGFGIPPEHLSRIFERFYRVDKSRSKKQGGSGLGLAISKHIIEAHNSKIDVESLVDKGTTFSFYLPKGSK
jgi:two-component system phosphate regulon sensor histidine kinase PhoR